MEDVGASGEQRKCTQVPADVSGGHRRARTQAEGVALDPDVRASPQAGEQAVDIASGAGARER